MSENERVYAIRKAKMLTMEKFGAAIGITSSAVSQIEKGKIGMTDQTRMFICREFNVNEEWLRTGEGEMFVPAPTDELDALAKRYNLSHGVYVLVEKLVNLPEERQQIIVDYVLGAARALLSEENLAHQPEYVPEMSKEEMRAEFERQWDLEKERKEKSEASGSGSSGVASA